jgi:hypothetical protein
MVILSVTPPRLYLRYNLSYKLVLRYLGVNLVNLEYTL